MKENVIAAPGTRLIKIIRLNLDRLNYALKTGNHFHAGPRDYSRRTENRTSPRSAQSAEIKKILLVEDEPSNLIVTSAFLENIGYNFDSSQSGEDALIKAKAFSYSLILMDVSIPVMDGLTVTQKIRSFERRSRVRHTPIIAMTAHAFEEDRWKCLEAGMDDYISKPFTESDLRAKLEQNMRFSSAKAGFKIS